MSVRHGDGTPCAGERSIGCSPSTTCQHGRTNVPQPRSILGADSVDCTACDYLPLINERTWEIRPSWLKESDEHPYGALSSFKPVDPTVFARRTGCTR